MLGLLLLSFCVLTVPLFYIFFPWSVFSLLSLSVVLDGFWSSFNCTNGYLFKNLSQIAFSVSVSCLQWLLSTKDASLPNSPRHPHHRPPALEAGCSVAGLSAVQVARCRCGKVLQESVTASLRAALGVFWGAGTWRPPRPVQDILF